MHYRDYKLFYMELRNHPPVEIIHMVRTLNFQKTNVSYPLVHTGR